MREEAAQFKAALQGASCANAGKVEEAATPAACKKLETTCLSFLDDGADDDDEDVTKETTCDGGKTTYSDDEECDGEADCMDGADEADCE